MAYLLTRIITTRHHKSGHHQQERITLPPAHSFALPAGYQKVSDGLHVRYAVEDGKDVIDAWHVSERHPTEIIA